MFDHATSVVIGETAVIEDDFSMLHEVTLGGTGKVGGDRHPKIGKGVTVSYTHLTVGVPVIPELKAWFVICCTHGANVSLAKVAVTSAEAPACWAKSIS